MTPRSHPEPTPRPRKRNHLRKLSPPPPLVEIAAVAGPFDKNESVRLVLPCRDREVSNISGGVMFDWGLLAPPVLFLFVNRLPGNVVIIVAEASICSFRGGRREGGSCPRFKSIFPGADGRPRGGGGGCWGGEEGAVYSPVSFTQECRRTQQPGCLCLYRLMVQTQLASIGSRALE